MFIDNLLITEQMVYSFLAFDIDILFSVNNAMIHKHNVNDFLLIKKKTFARNVTQTWNVIRMTHILYFKNIAIMETFF